MATFVHDAFASATAQMARGNFSIAQKQLEAAILADPQDARLHWQLGVAHASVNQLNLAHDCFRHAVRLDPSLAPAHACLGAWYLKAGMIDLALEASSKSFALAPNNSRIILSHARIFEAAGQFDAAWNLTEELIAKDFVIPGVIRLYGRMARYRNQQSAALTLAQRSLADKNLPAAERAAVHFTAADLLDSLGRYDEAFAHAAAGNACWHPRYDPKVHEKSFDRFIDYFTAERMRRLSRSAEVSAVPVFIVGMPRSGTSLIEQILASHPAVYGAGELDFLEHVFHGVVAMLGAKTADYPECLDRLTVDQATGMGQIYLQPLLALSPASPRITDKLPLNFLHLGLINLLLPGCRVIHCRREAMDTCLSCHMNSFAAGQDFKFDLTHLGLFHRQYQRLMAHWSVRSICRCSK